MEKENKIIGIIPARYASARLPMFIYKIEEDTVKMASAVNLIVIFIIKKILI